MNCVFLLVLRTYTLAMSILHSHSAKMILFAGCFVRVTFGKLWIFWYSLGIAHCFLKFPILPLWMLQATNAFIACDVLVDGSQTWLCHVTCLCLISGFCMWFHDFLKPNHKLQKYFTSVGMRVGLYWGNWFWCKNTAALRHS